MRFSGQNVTCEITTSFWLSLCESAPSQWGPAPGQGHLSGPRPRPSVGGVLGRAGSGAERIASCGENWPHRPTCARPRLGRGAWCVVLCRGRQKWTCGCGHFRARAKAPGSFPPGEWRQSCKTNRSWEVRGKGRAWLFLRWRCCLRGEARGDTAQRTTQATPLPEPGAGMASVGHSVMMVLNPASPGAAETAWGSSCLCAPLGAVCPDTRLEAVPG